MSDESTSPPAGNDLRLLPGEERDWLEEAAREDASWRLGALEERAALFRGLVELLPATTYVAAPDSLRPWFVSPRVAKLVGYEPRELLRADTYWTGIVHPEDSEPVRQEIREKLGADGSFRVEYRVRHRSGSLVWIQDEGTLQRPSGSWTAVVGVLTDVTVRKKLEEQLLQSEKTRTLGLLAGGMAHDFGNILTVVKGYAGLAQGHVAPDSPAVHAIREILRSAERGASLTRRLMVLARRRSSEPVAIDINGVVLELSELLGRLMGEDVQIVLGLSPEPNVVRMDPAEVWQVVLNAALNARDAMPRGGTLTVETSRVDLEGGAGLVRLAVRDTGTGMAAETLARAFEPFFSTKSAGAGTGLGLATIQSIVTSRGGRVEMSSRPAEGTVVSVLLPRLDEAVEVVPAGFRGSGLGRVGETVLLVEDEAPVRSVLAAALKNAGYHVLGAGTAEDALRIAELYDAEIHLLVADVVLPRSSGPELARQIQAARPACRLLFLSAYPAEALGGYGIGEGGPLLQKPFPQDAFLSTVRGVLER